MPVVAQLQPNVVKLVTSAEKATADLGDSVAKAFSALLFLFLLAGVHSFSVSSCTI